MNRPVKTTASDAAARSTSGLEVVRAPVELRSRVAAWKAAGLRVGFVPTMGALHEGHLALVRRAAGSGDRVVASVFVNPTQFGPDEDFERYPRQPKADAELLAAAGADLLFLPDVETIYPPGHSVFVELDETGPAPSRGMEGTFRPGHFRGVATVVTQLFNLVRPDFAVFGQKDAQQLAVVRRLVRDLHLDVEIVAHETIRESDGLAMSSRNAYLTPEQRSAAARIRRVLEAARERILQGERDADALRTFMRHELESEPLFTFNYAEVVDTETFQPVDRIDGPVTLPVAVALGATRLLDNIQINPPTR